MKLRLLSPVIVFGIAAVLAATMAGATEFDPVQATDVYLAAVSPEAEASTNAYVNAGYPLMVVELVLDLGIALLLLRLGWSVRWRNFAERVLRRKFLQPLVYMPIFVGVTTLLLFPLSWYRDFHIEHKYGLSTQAFGAWFGEFLLGNLVGAIGLSVFIACLYLILRKSPQRWWLWGAGLTVSFFALLLLISPLYIQPLFNDYRAMDEGPVKARILSLARANGMSVDDVKQVDESKQSTRISANVSGLFGTTRIALNDNLLKRVSVEGVEAVMAHEIGHYVLHHQWKMMAFMGLISVFGFALADALFRSLLRRRGAAWGIRGVDDLAGFPLFYAISALLLFICTPLFFKFVYVQEAEADLFAINATQNPDAWAEIALTSAEYRKLRPPQWEEDWLNHHPSPYSRIYMAMRWKAENLPADEAPVEETTP